MGRSPNFRPGEKVTIAHDNRVKALTNADSTEDTRWPNGDKPVSGTALGFDAVKYAALGSFLSLPINQTATFNIRSILTGSEKDSATLSLVTISGNDAGTGGWALSGDNLVFSGHSANSGGVLEVIATPAHGSPVPLPQSSWSSADPSSDAMAPTTPTGLVLTSVANGIQAAWDTSGDGYDGSTAPGGVDHYNVYKSSVSPANKLSPAVASPSASAMPRLTTTNIGGFSPAPTVTQNKQAWTVTTAGAGFHGVASDECEFFGAQVSGDFAIQLKVGAFTSSNQFSPAGIIIRESRAPNSVFIAFYVQPGALGLQGKSRDATGAISSNFLSVANIAGPVWLKVIGTGSTFTLLYSQDGGQWKVAGTKTLAMAQNREIGAVAASQTAGTPFTVTFSDINLTAGGSVSTVIQTAVSLILGVTAVDKAGNESPGSIFILGTPPIIPTGNKKHTPGHYGNFNTSIANAAYVLGGDVLNQFNAIKPYQRIVGMHQKIEWGPLEPIKGELDVTAQYPQGYATGARLIKSLRDYLASMTPPRKLVPYAGTGYVTSTHPGSTDYGTFPKWLVTDPAYGSPGGGTAGYKVKNADGTFTTTRVAGAYGWWGADIGQGGRTCTFSFSRPAILARYIKMWQVFGDYFNDDDMIEGIDFAENSFIRGANQLGGCPDFDYNVWLQSERDFLTAIAPHWPDTPIQWQNTFENNGADTQTTLDWMMANGIEWGSTDTFGQTYVNSHNGSPYTQGAQGMCGKLTAGSRNYRDEGRMLAPEIEAPDFGAYLGGGYTPADILTCLNTTLKAGKAYWVILTNPASTYGASFKPAGQWDTLGPFLNDPANALLNTSRPSNYT